MVRRGLFYGIKKEIMQYLMEHPDLKDCTATKMIKEGGVRKTLVQRRFLQKHLNELIDGGFISSMAVSDPTRSGPLVTYYTLKPRCKEAGDVGIPRHVAMCADLYTEILQDFYGNLEVTYLPIRKDFCALCEDYQKMLNKEMSCDLFIDIFQCKQRNTMNELTKEGLTLGDIKELRKKADNWEKLEMDPLPLFLEDLTITLIGYFMYHSYWPSCQDCKEYEHCFNVGQTWVAELLSQYLDALPESDLVKFWKSIVSGVPEIKTNLLEKYFGSRFNLKKEHNSTILLKNFEDRRVLPYFYSKIIPLSLELLVENVIMPCMKEFGSIHKKYSEKIKLKPNESSTKLVAHA